MDNPTRREAIEVVATVSAKLIASTIGGADEPKDKEKTMAEPSDKILQEMAKQAKSVSKKAFCPHSKFPVGAVVLTDDGQMFEGCNVESASYGLTICAERNAIFQMVAKGKKTIVAVMVCTPTPNPTAPCGACRQVIYEFGSDALVMSVCDGPEVLKKKITELLPDAFKL